MRRSTSRSSTARLWLLVLALSAPACGDDGSDAGAMDAAARDGGEGADGGSASDGGVVDGGSANDDGGTASDDGGTASDDGGAASDDGGAASDDGGAASDDGGAASDDGGAASDDGGPADGGPTDSGASDGGPGPVTCTETGLTLETISDSASSGTPDSYFRDVRPGDPFCAEISGGGSGTWTVNVSNGTTSGLYCSGSPTCAIRVPPGDTTLIVTAVTTDIGGYTLRIRRIPP